MVSSMKFPLTRRKGESPGSGRPSIIPSPSPATTTQNIGWMTSMPEGMILLVWRLFGIPNGGLTNNSLFFAVSEVNALNYWARARRLTSESQLAFRRKFSRGMLQNKLDSEVHCPGISAHTWKRSSGSPAPAHDLWTRLKFTGAWDLTTNKWSYVKTKYLKTWCSGCSCNVRIYFSCNKKATLCTKFWGVHKSAQGSTS